MNLQMITAANTLNQLQKKVDLISNNIANLNTVGYKRSEGTFQDLLTQNIKNQPHAPKEAGRVTPYGIRVGHGARISQTTMRFEQGAPQETGRALDFMIEGEGYWFRTARTWVDEQGNAQREDFYTRNGAFQLQPVSQEANAPMRLVTNTGFPVLNQNGEEIVVPAENNQIEVDAGGNVRAVNPATGEAIAIQLGVAKINRHDLLEAVGEGQYRLPRNLAELQAEGAVEAANPANFAIRQGALEMSNVDMTLEMSELMTTQRLMQFQSRAISMANDMMGIANSIRG